MKRLAPLALTAALILTACSGEGDAGSGPVETSREDLSLAMATDSYNETAIENGDAQIAMEDFIDVAQKLVCDQLPEQPLRGDFTALAKSLQETEGISQSTAVSLGIQGAAEACPEKYESAFP